MSDSTLPIFLRRALSAMSAALVMTCLSPAVSAKAPAGNTRKPSQEAKAKPAGEKPDAAPVPETTSEKPSKADEAAPDAAKIDPDDEAAAEEAEAEAAAVARPVDPEPVQIFGWREFIFVDGVEEKIKAKLDTGALTSSIHAEEKELFERDGKKWVRFIVTDPSLEKPIRTRVEAPLVRTARIKEPGGKSQAREVVRLSIKLGDRRVRGEFTLNNRSNMLAPVLIGRNMIKDLGWVDATRVHLADKKILR